MDVKEWQGKKAALSVEGYVRVRWGIDALFPCFRKKNIEFFYGWFSKIDDKQF